MASISNDARVPSQFFSVVLPQSGRKWIRAQSHKRWRTQSTAVASECAGSMKASGREYSEKQNHSLYEGAEKNGQRSADATDGRDRKITSCGSDATTCGGRALEMDGSVDAAGNVLEFDTNEQNVYSRNRAKRFKRGAQQHVCNNEKMHPRNRHKGLFLDYSQLAQKYSYLKPHLRDARFGQCNIDFREPLALYSLSKAILKEFYSLEFQLPVGESNRFLIPCVPSRANYIHHIADLLADVDVEATAYLKGEIPGSDTSLEYQNSGDNIRTHDGDDRPSTTPSNLPGTVVDSSTRWSSSRDSCRDSASRGSGETPTCEVSSGSALSSAPVDDCSDPATIHCSHSGSTRNTDDLIHPLRGEGVKVLDIGVGANCIYPMLGTKEYGWKFVGSDVSETSLAIAEQNLRTNALDGKVCLRLQPDRDKCFVNIVKPGELYSLTMCNPPFHSSRDQVNVCPVRVLDAREHEVICEGGECQFISGMIEESKAVCAQVLWFTTLVARAATVKQVKKRIWEELRCFNHEKLRQEKYMESLWRKRASAVKTADGRRNGESHEGNLVTNLRAEAADVRRNQATSLAQTETTACAQKHEEKGTEGPAHKAEKCREEKRTPDLPGKVFQEGKSALLHTADGSLEEKARCREGIEGYEAKRVGEEVPGGLPCSLEEQTATSCQEWPSELPVHICEFRVKELLQGKQTRWVICWTYWTAEQRKMVRNYIRENIH